jgi:quinolinate synthase
MRTQEKLPVIPITEIEQSAFCRNDEPLDVKPLAEEFSAPIRWQGIPSEYLNMNGTDLTRRIKIARETLSDRVAILGHHYQREEVIQFADVRGDSFKLSQYAASLPDAEFIVFCGVHFMAETADILSGSHQKVILPNITAGCSMSDMAKTEDVLDCWEDLENILGKGGIIPVTYMNSTADIKALCGRNNGIVCTSSNAAEVINWAFTQGERILFLPDQHLGRNTGLSLGIKLEEMVLWNPFKALGGNSEASLKNARIVLWQGHCSVHTRFNLGQISKARETYPDVNVIVHPECTMEVVQESDYNGSTEYIIKTIQEAEPGTKWAIGTEISLVNRLAKENSDKVVFCLDSVVCPCSTMYRIHPAYLLWVLEGLIEGNVINQVSVDKEIAYQAGIALDRMLQIS